MSGWQEISAQFYGNRLLFGDPNERGIVAVEIASRSEVEIFKREGERVTRERRPIQLFAIVEDREALRGFKAAHQVTELKGDFRFRHLVTLASTEALEALKRHLKNVTGKTSGSPEAPYLLLSDPVEQYLMLIRVGRERGRVDRQEHQRRAAVIRHDRLHAGENQRRNSQYRKADEVPVDDRNVVRGNI